MATRINALEQMAKYGAGPELKLARAKLKSMGAAIPANTARMPKKVGPMAGAARAQGRTAAGMGMAVRGPGMSIEAVRGKPIAAAKRGKFTAKQIAGGIVAATAFGTYRNRSGSAADPMGRTRPTGMYGY